MNIRIILITVMLGLAFYFYPQPKSEAFDPVTIALLTPVAIEGARIAAPYVFAALGRMGQTGLKAGGALLDIFNLPLGLLQCTLLMPFGNNFSAGIKRTITGAIAPFRFAGHILMLPLSAVGF